MDYLIIRITEHSVVAARFVLSRRNVTLDGAAEFTLDSNLSLAEAAEKIASATGGSPRVVLCLSPALFAQRTLELPLTDLRKVREILSAQLQGEIALPAEDALFDALPVTTGRFLALWAKRADVVSVVELFREAGCEPQVVSAAPFAWPYLPGIPGDCVVSDGSAMTVIAGGRLSFVRAFDGDDPQKQLAATLSALDAAGGGVPARLIVFGDRSGSVAAPKGLQLETSLLELPDDLVQTFRTEAAFQQLAGMLAVARACHAADFPDFRRGDLAWTAGNEKLRRQLRVTAVLAVAVAILLFVSKGLQYRAAKADLASLNSSISSQYREIFPGRNKAVDELAEVKGELRKLAGTESAGNSLDILKKLAEARGTTINGLYETELEGRIVRVKGDARSAQAVNDFKTALSGLLATIELGEIKSRPDGSVSFTLSGQLKEGGR